MPKSYSERGSASPYKNILDEEDDELLPPEVHHGKYMQSGTEEDQESLYGSSRNKCSSLADRVLFSTWYYVLYVMVLLTNCLLIIWLLVMIAQDKYSHTAHWAFIFLDVLVNIAFVSEVSLQIVSQKTDYFKHASNIFDTVVMLLSLVTLLMYISKTNEAEEVEDLVALLLMGFRYGLQFLRLISIIKKHKHKVISQKGVDFNSLKPEDFHMLGR